MCSIAGYINPKLSKEECAALSGSMFHRGPDNATLKEYAFRATKLFLAHNRLSIQDLSSHANQPMESSRYSFVFNGEIYNHLEIRKTLPQAAFKTHSDTETLLFAFEEFGIEKTLEQLIGMFAIALLDKQEEKLYLIRDRIGIKPLYWSVGEREFAFASELKGIPAHLRQRTSDKSLVQFVSLGYIPGGASYFKGVNKLESAHYLVFDGARVDIRRYWDLPPQKNNDSFETALEKTEGLLRSSVRYRLLSDLEVGSFLSGGVDSSLVTALMQQESKGRVKAFSIGFDVKGYDESQYASEVAAHLGVEHHVYRFSHGDVLDLLEDFDRYFDEPFGDASALPMMLLSRFTKNKVTVALSGDGGDELFWGYDRYFFTDDMNRKLSYLPLWLRKVAGSVLAHSGMDRLEKMAYPLAHPGKVHLYAVMATALRPWHTASLFSKEYVEAAFGKTEITYLDLVEVAPLDLEDTFETFSTIDIKRYLPDDILTKVDRASMKYSLEARVPLLDHRVVEYAYALPARVKLRYGPKSVLKAVLGRYLPKELVERKKAGFSVPLKEWFRGELKDVMYGRLEMLDERFDKRQLKRVADDHVYHNKNHAYLLWNLMRVANVQR